MFKATVPVKFMGIEERSGEKNGKEWRMKEAVVFVNDLGKVKIPVRERRGETPLTLPEVGSVGALTLSPEQGKFGSLQLVWDKETVFQQIQQAKAA